MRDVELRYQRNRGLTAKAHSSTRKSTKIVLVGLNYKDHAKELEMPLPPEPILFMKPVTALIWPDEGIIYPPQAARVDYEAELAIIIKDVCKDVEPEGVMEHVEGFTYLNDVTARDMQKKDGQWTRGQRALTRSAQ